MSTPSFGDLRLIEACAQPGCPVCRCLAESSRSQLDSLLYEQVTDPETRRALRDSWGFCSWHTWMLLEIQGSRTGAAIVSEDLLRRLIDHVGQATRATRPRRLGAWFADRRARAAERLTTLYRRRPRCPVCARAREAEQRHLEFVLTRAADPEFRAAYAGSDGLCAPHAIRAIELSPRSPGLSALLQSTLRTWSSIREDLAAFVARHDHRNTRPFTEAEVAACRRALEVLSGAPGLFGNDLRDRSAS